MILERQYIRKLYKSTLYINTYINNINKRVIFKLLIIL
jgi:hypothetical protein